MWDMAVMSIAKELGLQIHLSTQASVSNFEALKAYAELGPRRVVLAREAAGQERREGEPALLTRKERWVDRCARQLFTRSR